MALNTLSDLMQAGKQRMLPKNQIVEYSDTAAFFLLSEGYVKRYLITKEGEMVVQSIYGPGQFFPLTPIFSEMLQYSLNVPEHDKTYVYQAMTDVRVCTSSIEELNEACKRNPLLYKDILYEAGRRLRSNIHQLDNQALRSARWRVAHHLVYLASEYGEETEEGIRISIPLTHRDLASMLNMSRETISRITVRLQEQGYLAASKDFIIPSTEALRTIYS